MYAGRDRQRENFVTTAVVDADYERAQNLAWRTDGSVPCSQWLQPATVVRTARAATSTARREVEVRGKERRASSHERIFTIGHPRAHPNPVPNSHPQDCVTMFCVAIQNSSEQCSQWVVAEVASGRLLNEERCCARTIPSLHPSSPRFRPRTCLGSTNPLPYLKISRARAIPVPQGPEIMTLE